MSGPQIPGESVWGVDAEKFDAALGSITSLMAVLTFSPMVTSANSGTQVTKIPFWNTGYKNTIGPEVAYCQDQGLHRLIYGSGANCLHFCPVMLADDPGDGTGNRGCT
jgi:hypothetical protein